MNAVAARFFHTPTPTRPRFAGAGVFNCQQPLDFGGFTIPDCFTDYTAAARAKRASERNDFFTRLGSRVRKLY